MKQSDLPHRKRARSSLLTRGEPIVWVCSGALVFAVAMIVFLLGKIVYEGTSAFIPVPMERLVLQDGREIIGEPVRIERFTPDSFFWNGISAEQKLAAEQEAAANDGTLGRRLLRTGNFRFTNTHFTWIDDSKIVTEEQPKELVVFEQLTWGRFYGVPVSFTVDGEQVAKGYEETWAAYEQHMPAVVERRDQKYAIEKHDIGALSYQERQAKLIADQATLEVHREDESKLSGTGLTLLWLLVVACAAGAVLTFNAAKRDDPDPKRRDRLLRLLPIGLGSGAVLMTLVAIVCMLPPATKTELQADAQAAQAAYEQTIEDSKKANERLRTKALALGAENEKFVMQVRVAGGDLHDVRLDNVVIAYRANELGVGGKLGIYFHRVFEFIFDNPRTANSEGGVYPAIFGTVVMTILMTIITVPFGVLAALYLREYAKDGPVVSMIRIAINNLAGVPSIVFGVFGLGFFCYLVGDWVDTGPGANTALTMGGWVASFASLAMTVVLAMACMLLRQQLSQYKQSKFSRLGLVIVLALFAIDLVTSTLISFYLPVLLVAGLAVLMTSNKLMSGGVFFETRTFINHMIMLMWLKAVLLLVFVIGLAPFFHGFYEAEAVVDNTPHFGTGGIMWAAFTLALLTLPVVIVATEEALAAVPNSMREGSYACGASRWQTIRRIVLPRAMPGIMTGMILAMARGAGEVAPLMIVGAVKLAPSLPVDFSSWGGDIGPLPTGPLHPERAFMHLGFHIYDLGFASPNVEATRPMVYTTAMLLISIVFTLNLCAFFLRARLARKFKGAAF